MKGQHSFLGTGWKFPPTFSKNQKSVDMVSDERDIRESLYILLSTKPGERVKWKDYGVNLHQFVFEALNDTLITRIQNIIKEAVIAFEPRVNLNMVEVQEDKNQQGLLLINLDYTVRDTNSRDNIVFPYYMMH